jgi:hypothetical protein
MRFLQPSHRIVLPHGMGGRTILRGKQYEPGKSYTGGMVEAFRNGASLS